MQIPHDRLDPQTLRRVIEEFVTRDGTDLADAEVKVKQVMRLLERGEAVITFDEDEGTCSISKVDGSRRRMA